MKEKHMFKKKTAPRGRLGLAATGASPMYNHIKITGPNIEDLFPVSPRDKLGATWGGLSELTPFKRSKALKESKKRFLGQIAQ